MEIIIKSWPVLTFFLLFQTTLYSRPLKFGAFNVKSFGIAKVERPHVLKSLTQILIRYDVVLLQEIRDKSLFAVEKLHESINKFSPYKVIVSSPDGRSRYKEQYAYFFREGYFEYFKSSVYPDPKDYFERNPFLLHIRPKSSKKGLFIIGAHIKPSDAVNEIKALEKVYAYGKKHFKEKDALIMGDLNADCSYMNNNELDRAFFNTSDFFHSVIHRSEDTTTRSSTDCAYDRIILTDDLFFRKKSPKTYNFLKELHLTEEEALQISDHFPVEVTLYL